MVQTTAIQAEKSSPSSTLLFVKLTRQIIKNPLINFFHVPVSYSTSMDCTQLVAVIDHNTV